MKKILASFANNRVFANIVLLMIFMIGSISAFVILREGMPQFSLDMITISVPYPGADPEEVEEGISRKIEEAIEGMEGIKQFTTYSGENGGSAYIDVKKGYEPQEVLDRIKTAIDSISTFPVDAEKPVIQEFILKHQVMFLYISGDMSEKQLKEWSERLKDELIQLPAVSQISVFGSRNYEIGIELSEERLREYGLTIEEVTNSVRASSLNMAGGTIKTQGEEIRIRTIGRKYTGEELASIVVVAKPSGEIITLDRIAKINDGFEEDPITGAINGEPALIFMVDKTKEEDSIAIAKAVRTFMKEKKQQLPDGANFEILYDDTIMLEDRINLLVRNGMIGLTIVFVLLWAFLNGRLSFWSGMGIPISIAGALGILWFMGGTLNMISLFAFILVLGIIVDDAIVVGEAIYVHRKNGKPPLRAAVDGITEVGMPVVAAVLTTIVAFIPLLYIGGIMGKFISILPVVVIACLSISLVECLILLPAHLNHLPDPNKRDKTRFFLFRALDSVHHFTSRGMEWFVEKIYTPFLSRTLRWRYVAFSIAVAVLLISIGFVQGGILKFEIFPKVDGFVGNAIIEFPKGTPVEITTQAVAQVENALMRLEEKTETISGEPLVENRLVVIGQTLGYEDSSGPHIAQIQVFFLDSEKRGFHIEELLLAWEKEVNPIPGLKSLTFSGMEEGPPGLPIEVWIQGRKMDDILAASEDMKEKLKKFDGVYQIISDFSPGKNELRLELKPEARALGLTVNDLARQVYAGYYGSEAVRLQRGSDDIRVKVRYTADERSKITDLKKMRIRTRGGQEVPLVSVANISFAQGYSTIIRTNGMRRVAVSANVDTHKANANEILTELDLAFFKQLENKYPGIMVEAQGEQKKMQDSFDSLVVGYPVAILGIFIIVATMFRSYVQPFIIMFTVPFGIIGAIMGHLILGYDLSIMSIFGMVALTGVVVNDAIVLIERVNGNLAEGMTFFDALIKGGARRFRAVFLTTVSTVGGLTPLIMETNFQAKFLIPMAISMAAGVAFATLLTLLLIPSLMAILNDFRLLVYYIRHGCWAKRHEVEPASDRLVDHMKDPDQDTGEDRLIADEPLAGSPVFPKISNQES